MGKSRTGKLYLLLTAFNYSVIFKITQQQKLQRLTETNVPKPVACHMTLSLDPHDLQRHAKLNLRPDDVRDVPRDIPRL